MNFEPSAYQQAIFDFVLTGTGNGVVNAVAGSGKSTTILECAKMVQGSSLFVAFNKHIADHLAKKLDGTMCSARTIHSLGYGCLANELGKGLRVDTRKYYKLVQAYVDHLSLTWQVSDDDDVPTSHAAVSALHDLIDKVRVTLTDPGDGEAVAAVIEKFGIDIHPHLVGAVGMLLKQGETAARTTKVIDYTDMIYLPYLWRLTPPRFDWVFVDECQDLSAAQLDLVLKTQAKDGRMLFVGDRNQAIMGFAGADAYSFDNIRQRVTATLLPLSICYRCPTSHLDLAREIVPQIEARPGAPQGVVETISEDMLQTQIRDGDMVLCRLTAPLVSLCIKLIARRIPARVRGRDIGKQLSSMVRDVAMIHGFAYDDFPLFLEAYRRKQTLKLEKKNASEMQMESLNDRCDGVLACYEGFDATTVDSLCDGITGLFSDDRISVTLSTVHKAKGLENERVFLIKPEKMPLKLKNQQAWQIEQEYNVKYVALTRAMSDLYFVTSAPSVRVMAEPVTTEPVTTEPVSADVQMVSDDRAAQPTLKRSLNEEVVYDAGSVQVIKVSGKPMCFRTLRGGELIDETTCAPQSWRKVQQQVVARAAAL